MLTTAASMMTLPSASACPSFVPSCPTSQSTSAEKSSAIPTAVTESMTAPLTVVLSRKPESREKTMFASKVATSTPSRCHSESVIPWNHTSIV